MLVAGLVLMNAVKGSVLVHEWVIPCRSAVNWCTVHCVHFAITVISTWGLACSALVNRCMVRAKMIPHGARMNRAPSEAVKATEERIVLGARAPAVGYFIYAQLHQVLSKQGHEIGTAFAKACTEC
jgi:uncharacterized membrane protein